MLKILQARLQQYMNREFPDVQVRFRKGRGTRDQIANIHWIIEKAREFQKTSISALLTMPKPLTVWITTNCGKFWERWEYQTTWPALEKSVCRSGSNSYDNMDEPLRLYGNWNQSDKERQVLYDLTYMWNLTQNQQEKLIEKEVWFVVTRGREWGWAELEESGQKVQTYSYSISKHWGFNIVTQ